jgi:transposase InsO family protein
MVYLVPTQTTAKAIDIAWLYLCEVVQLYGLPKSIVSDRDTKFISKFWKELHRIMGMKLMMSTAYHPQMDGATEHAIHQVLQVLRSLIKPDQTNWADQCPMVEFTMNLTISSTMEFAPFELNYGWMPTIMTELNNTQYNGVQQFAKQALQNLSVAHNAIITNRVSQIEQANKLR